MTDVNKFLTFAYNYNHDFIKEIWGGTHLEDHLGSKFHNIYERVGAKAVMIDFYMELDGSNRQKLEDYACKTAVSL